MFQHSRSVEFFLVDFKEDINGYAVKQISLEKVVRSLEQSFARIPLLEKSAPEQCITKRNKQKSNSGEKG